MALGIPYLGFLIPIAVTFRRFQRESTPQHGVCSGCNRQRDLTYALASQKRICMLCVELVLATHIEPLPDFPPQPPSPEGPPVERVGLIGMEPVPQPFHEAFPYP